MGTIAETSAIVEYAGTLWTIVLHAHATLGELGAEESDEIDAGRVLVAHEERKAAQAALDHALDRLALLRAHAPHAEIGRAVKARNARLFAQRSEP